MSDLRYRTFRVGVYARLCPPDLAPRERDRFLALVEQGDEDGMETFFAERPLEERPRRVVRILKEARELGERLNVMDRTLPALPHRETTECYNRLRDLGNEIGDLEAAGIVG
jgi:hypothetical protein